MSSEDAAARTASSLPELSDSQSPKAALLESRSPAEEVTADDMLRQAMMTGGGSSAHDADSVITNLAIAERFERMERIKEFKTTVGKLRSRNIDLQTENGNLQTANAVLTERIAGVGTYRIASGLMFTIGGVISGLGASSPDDELRVLLCAAGIVLIVGATFMNWKKK